MKPDEVQATVEAMRDDAYISMTGKPAPRCADGGACHHRCEERAAACYRESTCGPLTGVFPGDRWPDQPAAKVALGQRVHFDYSDILTRQTIVPHSGPGGLYLKEWRKVVWGKRGDVRHGIIVGVRTLVNGESRWHYDEPITFHPVTYFTAYVVAYDLRRKPVHLLPDDVEVRR